MSYMQQMDNTSVYSAENDHNAVNNNPSYNTMNQFYANTKCPYTTGPGQAVIKPVYIVPNEQGNRGNHVRSELSTHDRLQQLLYNQYRLSISSIVLCATTIRNKVIVNRTVYNRRTKIVIIF